MWHKPCRTFHPWCLCIKTRCLSIHFSWLNHVCKRGPVEEQLTYWDRVTHICVSELCHHRFRLWFGAKPNPNQHWLIVNWTSLQLIKMQQFSFMKVRLKMYTKWWFCSGINVSTITADYSSVVRMLTISFAIRMITRTGVKAWFSAVAEDAI